MDLEFCLICFNISLVDFSMVWYVGLLVKFFLCLIIKGNLIKIVEYFIDRELKFIISGLELSIMVINVGVL